VGIQPSIGRVLVAADEQAADPALAVISYSLWRRRFASDPAIVGSSIVINRRSFTIVGVGPSRFIGAYKATFIQLQKPMLTIASMLGLAYLMNYSGMTSTLGLALAATGPAFPFFSATLGWLGVFLTGSDTSSNALFGNLQVVTANATGLSPVLMASVNTAAGVMGKMISVQSIAVAVAATGMTRADESRLFRFTIKHSILLMVVMGIVSLLFAYAFPGAVPVAPPK